MCLSAQQMDCSNVFDAGFDPVMIIHFTTEHLSMFKEDITLNESPRLRQLFIDHSLFTLLTIFVVADQRSEVTAPALAQEATECVCHTCVGVYVAAGVD